MFQNWCNTTSLNGMSDLFESRRHRWRFGFWIIVMLSMFALTILFIALNIINFINSPTMTNIETIADTNIYTPELLLCYNGGVNKFELKNIDFSEDAIMALQTGFQLRDASLDYSKLLIDFRQRLSKLNMAVEDFYSKVVGYPCGSVVKSRYLAGEQFIDRGCSNVSTFIGKFGKPCWLFQNNGHQKWPSPADGGIRINVVSPVGNDHKNVAYKHLGLTDSFDLVVEKNFIITTDQSVSCPVNYKTNILMSLTESIRIPKAKPCNADTTFTTSSACYHRCYNSMALNYCNCTFPGLTTKTLDPNSTMCDVFNFQANCFQLMSVSPVQSEAVACSQACVPICKEYLYTLTISYLPLNTYDNTANISVAYAYQQYTRIEEVSAFTWDVAVANIGGQVGLWMGCSVVTIIHAFFYIWIFIYQRFKSTAIRETDRK